SLFAESCAKSLPEPRIPARRQNPADTRHADVDQHDMGRREADGSATESSRKGVRLTISAPSLLEGGPTREGKNVEREHIHNGNQHQQAPPAGIPRFGEQLPERDDQDQPEYPHVSRA